jgi:chorismate-pyruvate lyase
MTTTTVLPPSMQGYFKTKGYVPGGIIINCKQENLDIEAMPPFLRALLVTDGTVTKSLEAYFWEPVVVENLGQCSIELTEDITWLGMKGGDVVLQREVLLKGSRTGNVYVYAKSLLRLGLLPQMIRDDMLAGKIGIGEIMRESGLETYREILDISREINESPVTLIGEAGRGEMICRTYRVFINHEATMLITEKFPYSLYSK